MTTSCVERIEEIGGIDTFRWIVRAVGIGYAVPTFGVSWVAMEVAFPDPTEYAGQIEGSPSKLAASAKILGPNSGKDLRSMAALYEKDIYADLINGVPELAEHWTGDAADEFVGGYKPELGKHLAALADTCEKQRGVAVEIQERIIAAHDAVVDATRQMVQGVIGVFVTQAGTQGAIVGYAAKTATKGAVAAVIASTAATAFIITKLVEGHSKIESAIDALNTDLGGKLKNSLEGIERREIARSVDRFVSKAGWERE